MNRSTRCTGILPSSANGPPAYLWRAQGLAPGVVVAAGEDQVIEIVVPVGYVTFIYEKADGTCDADKRIFLGRGAEGRGRVYTSGKAIALIPGVYNVAGWRGAYDPVVFEIAAGDEREITLRNKA